MDDPNILDFVSEFTEQHDAAVSFIICPLTGCDVHMGKDGDLESITIPKERLETIDRDTIRSVLNYLLTRLEAKGEYEEWLREANERIVKLVEEEE